MTVNTKQFFISTIYELLYKIHKCFPNAIYLLNIVILHVVNAYSSHIDYLAAIVPITVT